MNLQTLSGKPVTSGKALLANNFRPYSPQTADKIRLQPDAPGEQFAFTRRQSRHDVEPDTSDPATTVEIACQVKATTVTLTYLRGSIDGTTVESPRPNEGRP
jgi:hypothetical protein